MTSDVLLSPRFKLQRARALLRQATDLITEYTSVATCDFVIAPHPNDDTLRVAFIKVIEPVPIEVSLVVGDAVHNLRTALDHLACSLATANGQSMDDVAFPFGRDLSAYRNNASGKIKKLSKRARRFINLLRPYSGGNEYLYLLHRLDLQDKHRTLLLHSISLGKIEGRFSCDHEFQVTYELFGSLNEGIHFATFPAKATFEQNLRISIGVTFGDVPDFFWPPALEVLEKLANYIDRLIDITEKKLI